MSKNKNIKRCCVCERHGLNANCHVCGGHGWIEEITAKDAYKEACRCQRQKLGKLVPETIYKANRSWYYGAGYGEQWLAAWSIYNWENLK